MDGVERRLAAILAADVVGYSRLTGTDEEGTMRRLRILRDDLINPAIDSHRGRVVKEMGDGILVEFPSALDAVHAAREIQREMQGRNAGLSEDMRLELRIGIHIGDVIVQADGDLLGNTVNIAARLEGIAEPGGICLSEDAFRQVRNRVREQFADLGEQQLKNIVQPLRAFAMKNRVANQPAVDAPPQLTDNQIRTRDVKTSRQEQLRLPNPVRIRAPSLRLTIETVDKARRLLREMCHTR
jgi:adenylate cyclase